MTAIVLIGLFVNLSTLVLAFRWVLNRDRERMVRFRRMNEKVYLRIIKNLHTVAENMYERVRELSGDKSLTRTMLRADWARRQTHALLDMAADMIDSTTEDRDEVAVRYGAQLFDMDPEEVKKILDDVKRRQDDGGL